MSEAFVQCVRAVLDGAWQLFQILYPGTSFTFADIAIGLMIISISFTIYRLLFGVGGYRSSSTYNAKVSDERRDDEI